MEHFLHSPSEGNQPTSKVRFGCISWTYPDWLGSFYPKGTKSADYLQSYSKVFDLVEVDSSFYRQPTPSTVKQWNQKTPPGFLFSVKLPKKISHDARFVNVSRELEYFEDTISNLGEKLSCVIAQLPPQAKFESSFSNLVEFFDNTKLRYAFEFRNKSWFREETYALLSRKNASFVWSVNDRLDDLPPRLTTDFVYIRFMGKFGEFKKFNHVQKDRSDLLQNWWKSLNEVMDQVKFANVLVSNHFAGFAPTTVNELRKLAGDEELDWSSILSQKFS